MRRFSVGRIGMCLAGLAALAAFSLAPPTRAVAARNLAWLALQRAVLGSDGVPETHLDRAGRLFARAAGLDPGDPLALDGLGLVYLHYGAADLAENLFRRVPADSPWGDAARLHLLVAQTAALSPEQQGAVVGGVARDWCDPGGFERQVSALAEQGECGRAGEWRAWVESRCEMEPAVRARVRTHLGQCYVSRGQTLAGLDYLEDAAALWPESAPAWIALGDGWAAAGDAPNALQAYLRALELAPDSEAAASRLRALGSP